MPKAKRFFIFILVVLLVNAIFFSAWYGFGLRNKFREAVAGQLGKLLKGKVSISELHFSDRQLLSEGISFVSADSTIAVDIANLRVQYNLTRYIFSGFKTSRLIKEIEIIHPVVRYSYSYKPSPPKLRKPLILPNISDYFGSLYIRDGSVALGIRIPVTIIQAGDLVINEELYNINAKVINNGSSQITVDGLFAQKGSVKASGTLEKGRLSFSEIEVSSLTPNYVSHPDLRNISSDISLVGNVFQDTLGAAISYRAKAQIWDTRCLFAREYQAQIPYLGAEIDGKNLQAQISRSTFGSSNVTAEVKISDLGPDLHFDLAKAEANMDLSMITPDLTGFVNAKVDASGTIEDPFGTISLSAPKVAYQSYTASNFTLESTYDDNQLSYSIPTLEFQNHSLSLSGIFSPYTMILDTHISAQAQPGQTEPFAATADLDVHLELLDLYPYVDATINSLDFASGFARVNGISGYLKLMPVSMDNSYYVDAELKGEDGYQLSVVGDILDRNLLINADFKSISPSEIYALPLLQKMNPLVSGKVLAILRDNRISTYSNLDVELRGYLPYSSKLDFVGDFDIGTLEGNIHLKGIDGLMNNQALDFSLGASLKDKQLRLLGLRVNDILSLSGRMNLTNIEDSDFSLALWNINYHDLVRFYPQLDISLPEFTNLNVMADYNLRNSGRLEAGINLGSVDLLAVTPLGLNLGLSGPLDSILVRGNIDSPAQKILDLAGTIALMPQINLSLDATFNDLALQKVVLDSPVTGLIKGRAGVTITNLTDKDMQMELRSDLTASNIKIGELLMDKVIVKATQYPRKLQVDSLYVFSDGLFVVSSSGAIDYNAVTNEFFEGSNQLNLVADGQLFTWLKKLTPYILESKGNSSLTCTIGVQEEQFYVASGALDISDGFMRLKDQSEPLTNIALKGSFDKNRIVIERGNVQMGEGKLVFNNIFESDNSDHFMLGFIDLGILRLHIEEPGILANVPLFTPPKTLSNIVLKGLGSRFAMIKGPFDMMKISGEVVISNTSALFPPNTDNLLKLATSVKEAATRKNEIDAIPLPFTLDIIVTLGDNVNYVTYPAKLNIQPGGYLHLLYDGTVFTVQEAYFSSERGSVDIFGTVFQVEKVDITMIDSQDLLSVDGIFYKRAPDGTMITLKAITSPDRTKNFVDRLEFSLTSDNPQDRNISQILSRLRYSGSNDPGSDQGMQLQDEALSLISGNLDASLYTPFLSPAESFIRRKLKLDNFSINAGFLQNLYSQYSNDPNQLAANTDMKQLTTDIAQFSSSILLNNLSISMSKYLGRRLFLDYELELQEATDLQKRTRIMVSHNTSLRVLLPMQFRLGYTFQYTPWDAEISHEIMLQRSFRFWGL